jgi:hypothetical protein
LYAALDRKQYVKNVVGAADTSALPAAPLLGTSEH